MAANKRKIFNVVIIARHLLLPMKRNEEKKKEMKISCVWNMPDLGRYL